MLSLPSRMSNFVAAVTIEVFALGTVENSPAFLAEGAFFPEVIRNSIDIKRYRNDDLIRLLLLAPSRSLLVPIGAGHLPQSAFYRN